MPVADPHAAHLQGVLAEAGSEEGDRALDLQNLPEEATCG